MLKRSLIASIIIFSVCNISYANNRQELNSHIAKLFPYLQISQAQIEQLSWIIQSPKHSFDMDMHVKNNSMHIEISRALTRLYCLQLLRTGGRQAYEQFVAGQLSIKNATPLTMESFTKLCKHIQHLSIEDYELLKAATILSAVSLSVPAQKLAQQVIDLNTVHDNLEFLATTLRKDPTIYPLVADLLEDNLAAKKLLFILFPPQTNFRHMLYTEGGITMFNYIRIMIKHQYIDRSGLDLWYAHWVVNIAGFRGHVNQQGSIYLTEPVFQAMQHLKPLIYEMLDTPNFNPLIPYLEYRAQLLGLNNVLSQETLLLAHFGAMLRLYNFEDGVKLRRAFNNLNLQHKNELLRYFSKTLQEITLRTPTHAPALFCNALEVTNGDIERVIMVFIPIYNEAIALYLKQLKNGKLKADVPLSFNNLSATKNIQKILNSKEKLQLQIMSDGEVFLL